ncbi:hypothetical protein BDB00DRAFT_791547 [Zychaea mexicana]|uniref:uncharacterized protein n=1 Tax=Zychaea mexicana TaxID=64656 RepID=UPI0022FEF3BC|nr:uncharacterized protein BDB00DRAFT_791547 [Zychaea mexicana]KAI9488842.1 hypothetical protein BDB00DRAFT_791547 [Zychaea mexicana]
MEEDRSGSFNPPLWRQRRTFIRDILQKHNVSTVLDYGCGEASVLSFLISPTNDPVQITKLAGIDINPDVLQEAVQACQPWPDDYTHLRENPLIIDIYQGSVDQFDKRLVGYDALICSEVIEHLFAPTLDKFLDTTLGQYAPPLMVITTPNAEYNVNFDSLQYGTPNAVFRHDDHKFEWTRQEFEAWCRAGADKYDYDVEFQGIGLVEGKRDDLSFGHCTQACIFIIRNPSQQHKQHPQQQQQQQADATPHQLVLHTEFPYYREPALPEEQALIEIETYIASLCQVEPEEDNKQQHRRREWQHQQEPLVLKWCSDWTTIDTTSTATFTAPKSSPSAPSTPPLTDDNSDNNNDNPQSKRYTRVPQRFPYSILWDILRIRQVCKSEQRMIQILRANPANYQIEGKDLVVLKAFKVVDDEQEDDSISTVSSDPDGDYFS